MTQAPDTRARVQADTLLWQSRIRLGVAVVAGVAAYLLLQAGPARRPVWPLAISSLIYCAVVGGVAAVAAVARRVGQWAATLTVLSDVAFLFAVTLVASAPQYYERALVLSFAALVLGDLYFGRAQMLIGLVAAVLGYLVAVTVAIQHGAALSWSEELWTLTAFALVAATFLFQYGNWNRRLGGIVRLLERAEEGEFAAPYDLEADVHPDAVTLVGAAYNRVREQISSMVLTDPLTACVNRRGFEQELAREVSRATRAGSTFSLLALDVDYFKNVNDSRGHMAGDAVLREMGALLKQSRRAGDVVARTGGEEFSIILPDTALDGAFQLAARLCDAVRSHEFLRGEKPLQLTISIGVVTNGPDLRDDVAEEIKKRADDALYHAKRSGRNRVQKWTSGLSARRSGRVTESLRIITS